MSPTTLLLLALLYVASLFAIASYSERRGQSRRTSAWVYTLTLAVYCTSWTFYGAVGSMANEPWSHAPIYLGPILVFLLARPVLARMIDVGHRQRVTSLADFLGARYGKRRAVAAAVSVICLFAVLPYIALQLRALEQTWRVVSSRDLAVGIETNEVTLLAAAGLALFAILFGVRRLGGNERQYGLMHAMAVESVVKLIAFVGVALLSMRYLATADVTIDWSALGPAIDGDFMAHLLVSALAILCLPRQFHVTVVELEHPSQTRHIGWAMPAYLLLFMVLAAPVALAGQALFAGEPGISADTFVQRLPMRLDADWAVAAAFLGGISAATGMVLVATVSVSIMITNEIVTPLLFGLIASRSTVLLRVGTVLRWARMTTVVVISLIAWLVSASFAGRSNLADIGFLSFLGTAQVAPALLLGLYWRRVHGLAVLTGMLVGTAIWLGLGLLPLVLGPDDPLMGESGASDLSFAALTLLSLGSNTAIAILGSLRSSLSHADSRQLATFLDSSVEAAPLDDSPSPIRIAQLRNLVEPLLRGVAAERFWRVLENSYQQRLLPADRAPRFVVDAAEAVLANTVGATSARQIVDRLEEQRQLAVGDLTTMVGDAQRASSFNRESLEAAVEHLSHGVSVVDSELRLVAWNSDYERFFDYPERFLFVGCPIERVYRFNAERGILSPSGRSVDEEISRRLEFMRSGSPHQLERIMPDGRVLEIKGRPLPGGGFVTTYVDVTEQREMVIHLREVQDELQSRLASGEQALSERNAALRGEVRARTEAELKAREAFQGKAQFMAATSHDLLQPINAARLLAEAIRQQGPHSEPDNTALLKQLAESLDRAQGMIGELREIARLDAEALEVGAETVPLAGLFERLASAFSAAATDKGLTLHVVQSSLCVAADEGLLNRLMENLISNAIKYTREGKVLVGARPRGDRVLIQVLDTGPGIPESEQQRIFQEFERLDSDASSQVDGLGLGLSLVQRYARLMDAEIGVASIPGAGSAFSLSLPRATQQLVPGSANSSDVTNTAALSGTVLCIDNDRQLLTGLAALVQGFGLRSLSARSEQEAFTALSDTHSQPDVVIADYHLDNGCTGVQATAALITAGLTAPVIIVSADDEPEVRDDVRQAGHRFLPKPIEPDRLRVLLAALLDAANQAGSGES